MSPKGLSSAGRRNRFRVSATDPEPKSAAAVRLDLDLPSLSGDNRFTGDNVFEGDTELGPINVPDSTITLGGGFEHNGSEPAVFNGGADIDKRLEMGRIVVCQVMSGHRLTEGTTIVREFIEPNILITNSSGDNAQPVRLTSRDPNPAPDGREVHLRGIVETSIRVMR